jgi:transposase
MLSQWISCHVNAFEFFKGVPEIIVPDNLKTGVKKPCYYEPEINRTYLDMAAHYNTIIIPARVRKPKDKSKAEVAVQIVERQIMAALRNHTFFSVEEANTAVWEELINLNEKPMQKIKESRKELYISLDYPALKPLPQTKFNFAEYKTARVSFDYHIELENNFYSVPYQLVGQKVEARYSWDTVKILFKGERIALHQRSYCKREYVTLPVHRPEKHNSVYKWPPERIIEWAAKVGPYTGELVKKVIAQKVHFEQAYRQCRGIIRLGEEYGSPRVENASKRALTYGTYSYKSLLSILQKGLDNQPLQDEENSTTLTHENIRGSEYYKNSGGGL